MCHPGRVAAVARGLCGGRSCFGMGFPRDARVAFGSIHL